MVKVGVNWEIITKDHGVIIGKDFCNTDTAFADIARLLCDIFCSPNIMLV